MMVRTSIVLFSLILLHWSCQPERPEQSDDNVGLDKVVVRLEASPDRLNPILSKTEVATHIENLIMPALAEYDPVDLQLVPLLIEEVPVGLRINEGEHSGRMLYTMRLRDEARWDDGSAITSEDYLFTLKLVFNPFVQASWRNLLADIRHVFTDPSDPQAIGVVLESDIVLGQSIACNINLYPRHIYDAEDLMSDIPLEDLLTLSEDELEGRYPSLKTFAEQFLSAKYSREIVAGAGPYRLESWIENIEIQLVRKPDYWANQLSEDLRPLQAHPQEIHYKVIPDENTAVTALRDGQIDILPNVSALQFGELQDSGAPLDFHTPESSRYYYIALNQESPLLEDVETRRALAHLLDVDEIIDMLMGGLARRIQGPISPSAPYFHGGLDPIEFDLAEAKKLLAEAGWGDSDKDGILDRKVDGETQVLRLTLKTTPRRLGQQIGSVLQSNGSKVGVAIEIEAKPFNTYLAEMQNGDFHMANLVSVHFPGLYDPYGSWHTDNIGGQGRNYLRFGNEESDKAIETIRESIDPEIRNAAYMALQETIYENQPAIFLFAPAMRIVNAQRYDLLTSSQRPGYFEQNMVLDGSR